MAEQTQAEKDAAERVSKAERMNTEVLKRIGPKRTPKAAPKP